MSQQNVDGESGYNAEPVVVRLIDRFMQLEGCELTELPPLQESLDVDALEAVIDKPAEDQDISVEFEYNDRIVSLSNDGCISIQPPHR